MTFKQCLPRRGFHCPSRPGQAGTLLLCLLLGSAATQAQPGGGASSSARQAAPVDFTGYWVSVVSEDWKYRMVTPDAGVFDGIPLNAEGRRVGNAWDPAADAAADQQCKGYGAPALMRLPGRFHITWEDGDTLRIDSDYGSQTRRFHFDAARVGEPSRQGHSVARWQAAPDGGGSLKVETTNLSPGYHRKNGAPYSAQAVLTEYYDLHEMPNGDRWINITTRVDDPLYLSMPLINSTDLKALAGDQGWNSMPCTVR